MFRRNLSGEALIERATAIAREAHEGQMYGTAGPYFDVHILGVAGIIKTLGYDAFHIAGGLLHDTVEDTEVTLEFLRAERIPNVVVEAVNLLTKKEDQSQTEYLQAILAVDGHSFGVTAGGIAKVGKFAGSTFNFSWTALNSADIPDETRRTWMLEYAHNIAVLKPRLPRNTLEQEIFDLRMRTS